MAESSPVQVGPVAVLSPYLRGYLAAEASLIEIRGRLLVGLPASPYDARSPAYAGWFLGIWDSVQDRTQGVS